MGILDQVMFGFFFDIEDNTKISDEGVVQLMQEKLCIIHSKIWSNTSTWHRLMCLDDLPFPCTHNVYMLPLTEFSSLLASQEFFTG